MAERSGGSQADGRLGWSITSAFALLGGFLAASLAFAVLVYLPLQIDFCPVDPDEPQCIDRATGPSWPSIARWGVWIAAASACLSTVVFAYRADTHPRERRRFLVSMAAAVLLTGATAVAAYPLTRLV